MPLLSSVTSALTNATWPLGPIVALSMTPTPKPSEVEKKVEPTPSKPHASLEEHIQMQIGCIPRLLFCIYVYSQYGNWREYAQTLSLSWILPIILRDVALCLFVGLVDCSLLLSVHSPFKAKMAPFKFSSIYPHIFGPHGGTSGLLREALWCCCSAVIAGAFEVGVLHASATGRVSSLASDEWWADTRTVVLMLTWFYTQNIQFYTMHRCLHRWGTTSIPDVGAFLYEHIHKLHHQSKFPTAFSGISMHPIESTLYFSYALFPLLFGGHHMAFLYIKTNLIAAAMLGHSAFGAPGTGSLPHFLHHTLVGVNYAEAHLPLDHWLGTFAGSEEAAQECINKRFGKKGD